VSQYSDTELMSMLSSVLSPTPAVPDEAALARLHATLAELSNESGLTVVTPVRQPKRFVGLRGRMARRTSVVALATFLVTGGVATAGVATDTLPGPTRNLAYNLGLPVTSPGLNQARANLIQLKRSIDQGNRIAEVRWGRSLQHDLKDLNDNDLAQIRVPALSLLSVAGLEDPLRSPTTTSSTAPTTNDGSDSDGNSSNPTTSVPNNSGHDSSDKDSSGSIPLIPTLTVPNPRDPVPTTDSNVGGNDQFLPITTSPLNTDQLTTGVTLPLVSGDLPGGD
jgi:hypothetical protein